jgi:hypothetical protein
MTTNEIDLIPDQHRDLQEIARDLRGFLEKPRPELGTEGGCTWAEELADRLSLLDDKLLHHFRFEETSGFHDDLKDRHPRAIHAIEHLGREHKLILSDLCAIRGAALNYSAGKTATTPRLRRWALSLLDRLANHERQETDLLQAVHYYDLGIGD